MPIHEGRTTLSKDTRILTDCGTAVVVAVLAAGVKLRDSVGDVTHVSWPELTEARAIRDGEAAPLVGWMRPLWDAMSARAKSETMVRLEVVQEIVTGYRDGHPELAREGEPRAPFGPGFDVSLSKRCEVMAQRLGEEGQHDRVKQRRIRDGELQSAGKSPSTI